MLQKYFNKLVWLHFHGLGLNRFDTPSLITLPVALDLANIKALVEQIIVSYRVVYLVNK